MGKLNLDCKDVTRALRSKLKLDLRRGKESQGWYWLDNKKRFRVTLPHDHGALTAGTANSIRNQVKLSHDEFLDLVKCPMTGEDFEALMRAKVEAGEL